jgi:hypothetical protein
LFSFQSKAKVGETDYEWSNSISSPFSDMLIAMTSPRPSSLCNLDGKNHKFFACARDASTTLLKNNSNIDSKNI